jgi:hypothetical protein
MLLFIDMSENDWYKLGKRGKHISLSRLFTLAAIVAM